MKDFEQYFIGATCDWSPVSHSSDANSVNDCPIRLVSVSGAIGGGIGTLLFTFIFESRKNLIFADFSNVKIDSVWENVHCFIHVYFYGFVMR